MVAAADRSPARYIFELKLAEVPSGPLNSALVTLWSSLSQESIGAGALPLAGYARGRRLVNGTYHVLARPPRSTARAPEGLQIVRKNGPDDSHFDSVQSLPQQQTANVGLRCVELGGSLGNREQAGTFDLEILARARNHFLL